MKLKRTKLAALAMSALMAVSAFSPYVYAEESTEAETEVTTEAATEEVVSAEAATVVEAYDEASVVDNGYLTYSSFRFEDPVYNSDGTYSVTVIIVNSDGEDAIKEIVTGSGSDSTYDFSWKVTYTAATCKKAGSMEIKISGHDITATYKDDGSVVSVSGSGVLSDKVSTKGTTQLEKLDHTPKTTTTIRYVDANGDPVTNLSCLEATYAQYEIVCADCGESLGWTDGATPIDGAPHTWTTGVAYAIKSGDSDGNIVIGSSNITVSSSENEIVDAKGDCYDYLTSGTKLYAATLDSSGNVQVIDPEQDATYYLVHTCTSCGKTVYEKVTIYSTQAAYVTVEDFDGVEAFWYDSIIDGSRTYADRFDLNDLSGRKFSTSKTTSSTKYETIPDNDDIELTDCSKTGYYLLYYWSASGTYLGYEWVPVTAHHMEVKVAVFSSQEDMDKCTLSYASDGSLVVKSTDCNPVITYTEVTECYAENCKSTSCAKSSHGYEKHVEKVSLKDGVSTTGTQVFNGIVNGENKDICDYTVVGTAVTATAETGSHAWLGEVYRYINSEITTMEKANASVSSSTSANTTPKYVITRDTVDDLLTEALEQTGKTAYKKWVVVTNDTSSCTESGVVTLTFYCINEDAGATAVYTYDITVSARGHLDAGTVVTEYDPSTCTHQGSYVKVHKCDRDGCEYRYEEDEVVTLPRLAHTNEIEALYTAYNDDYDDDETNMNGSSIYLQLIGDRVVDTGASLLTLYNNGSSTLSGSSSNPVQISRYWSNILSENLVGGGSNNDSEKDTTLGVVVRVYTKCSVCGYEVDLTDDDSVGTGSGLTVSIDDIQAQDTNGAGGYIVLTASYTTSTGEVIPVTGTFNYYTSATAYNGRVDKDTAYDPDVTTKNGVYLEDGVYKYYVSDSWATSFSGIIEYNDGYYFVANGVLCTDASGLNLYNGTWYMLAYGKIQSQYTGVTIYDGETFYITNGVLDTSVTGLITYDGAQFLFCYGRLMDEVNGLWFYDSAIGGDDTFYYLAGGQVVDYTGAVIYDNTFFLVENGKLSTYTGTYVYDGATFNVVNGQFYDQVA